jgi:hypothetical protein
MAVAAGRRTARLIRIDIYDVCLLGGERDLQTEGMGVRYLKTGMIDTIQTELHRLVLACIILSGVHDIVARL